jgi:MFS family permease
MRLWGRLADRFGSKAIMVVCAPVFSLTLLMWTFTIKDNLLVSLILIALIHIMNGVATAGIDVAKGNLLYQLAPSQRATPFLASSALITSMAAGVAPILGGILGNLFKSQSLSIQFNWEQLTNSEVFSLTAIRFAHLDFVFLIAFVLGLIALNLLPQVQERKRDLPRKQMVRSVKQEIQSIGSMRGMRFLTQTASFKDKPKQDVDRDLFDDD